MKTIIALLISAFCLTSIGQTYDVLLYKDTPNPDGLPGDWPARVEVTTGRTAPWFQATRQQLEVYKATHKAAYDNWRSVKESAEKAAEDAKIAARDALIADSIADFQQALNNWAGLSAAQQKAVLKRCVEVLIAVLRNELNQ